MWRWLSCCLCLSLCLCNSWCQPSGPRRSKVRVSLDRQSDTNPQRTFSHQPVCNPAAQRAERSTAAVTPHCVIDALQDRRTSVCLSTDHTLLLLFLRLLSESSQGEISVILEVWLLRSLFSQITSCKRSSSRRPSVWGRTCCWTSSTYLFLQEQTDQRHQLLHLDYKFRSERA